MMTEGKSEPSSTDSRKREATPRRKPVRVAIGALALAVLGVIAYQSWLAWHIFHAYLYALPLFEIERVRYNTVFKPDNPHRHPENVLIHVRALSDHHTRFITTPNNDTLYSMAVLNLATTPVRLQTPDTRGRYYSVALIDAFTNNPVIVGRRTTGTGPQVYWIVGPGWQGSLPDDGAKIIHSPTNLALLLLRVLVDGPEDLAAANAIQDQFRVTPLWDSAPITPPPLPVEDVGSSFVAVVNDALRVNPPPAVDSEELSRAAAVGIGPMAHGDAPLAAWNRYLPWAHRLLKHLLDSGSPPVGGWQYSPPGIGNFGTRYALRAGVALAGLLALPPEEAMYTKAATDSQGHALDGKQHYQLHLPAGGIPVDAFWSMTMYEVETDGRLFFTDNQIHRYAIGDRTPGLRRNADGSIDIYIQAEPPDASMVSNWLPTPPGAFKLVARAYQPRRELLEGRFRYPALELVSH